MDLSLPDQHLARARVKHYRLVRRRRGVVQVATARHDKAQPARPRVVALRERLLPALQQRAGQAELGCDADRYVLLIPRRDHLLHARPCGLTVGGMDPVEAQA